MKHFLTAALAALAICAQAQVLTTAPKQSYSGITVGADTTVLPQRNCIEAESACFRGLPHAMPPMFLTIESNGCLVELTKEQAGQMLKISSIPDSMQPRKQKLRLSSIEVDTLHFDTIPIPRMTIDGGAGYLHVPAQNKINIPEAETFPLRLGNGGFEYVDVHPVYKTLPYEISPRQTSKSKNLIFFQWQTIGEGSDTTPHPCDFAHNTAFEDGCPVREYRICRVCLLYQSRGVDTITEESDFWELVKKLNLGQK